MHFLISFQVVLSEKKSFRCLTLYSQISSIYQRQGPGNPDVFCTHDAGTTKKNHVLAVPQTSSICLVCPTGIGLAKRIEEK
jgi:hypothetical protein